MRTSSSVIAPSDLRARAAGTRPPYGLLKAFADHPRRVLYRERLLDLANARDADAFDRAIEVRITRIRRKVEPIAG